MSYEDHVTSAERMQLRFVIFSFRDQGRPNKTKKARTLTETGTVKQKRPKRQVSNQYNLKGLHGQSDKKKVAVQVGDGRKHNGKTSTSAIEMNK